MMGANVAAWVLRLYSSAVGKSPVNPARSHPQNGMPEMPALKPALIESCSASKVEDWSPAQNTPVDCTPAVPARLKVMPIPVFSSAKS